MDKKISEQKGWIHREALDSSLNKSEGIKVEQGLLGNLLIYGKVSIVTLQRFTYPYMSNPKEFKMRMNHRVGLYNISQIINKNWKSMNDFQFF